MRATAVVVSTNASTFQYSEAGNREGVWRKEIRTYSISRPLAAIDREGYNMSKFFMVQRGEMRLPIWASS